MKSLVLPGTEIVLVFELEDEADRYDPGDIAIAIFDKNGRHSVVIDATEQRCLRRWLSSLVDSGLVRK